MNDDTTRHVFPTQVAVGLAPKWNCVFLHVTYKLSPDEPEEFQQRYALTKDQAVSIGQNLLSGAEELSAGQTD